MTGRLPDAVALHFLDTGLVGTAPVDRKRIDKAREAIRTVAARDPRARLRAEARTTCRAASARSARSARRASRADAWTAPLGDDSRAAIAAVLAGEAPGAVVEADNLAVLRAAPGRRPSTSPTPTRRSRPARTRRLVSIRTGGGRADPSRVRRPRVPLRGRLGPAYGTTPCRSTTHLAALRARVVEIHRVLAPHGSLYLHVRLADGPPRPAAARRGVRRRNDSSTRSSGPTTTAGGARDRWPRKHDSILWYAKGDAWTFERDAIDRIPYLAPGLVGPEKAARGKLPTDVWWMTIVPARFGRADRLPDPEAGATARADRRGVEPAGRPRARPVRRERHDGRRGRAPRAAMAARRPEPGGRRDRAGQAAGRGWRLTADPAPRRDHRDHPRLRQHPGPGARGRAARGRRRGPRPGDGRAPRAVRRRRSARGVWAEERERQFREEVPLFRETDLGQRIARVLARLRGMRRRRRTMSVGTTRRRAAQRRPGRGRVGDRGLLGGVRRAPAAAARSRRAARAPGGRGTSSRSCPTGRSR